MKSAGIDLIYSSDITRDKETSEIIGKELGLEVVFDERLREVNFAEYNERPYNEFDSKYSFEERWTKAPKGGETNMGIQKRMLDFINEINKKHEGKKILVVSHGDPLRITMKYFGSERPYPNYADPFEMDVSIADLHRPNIDEVVIQCKECGKDANLS